ncbi:restriction endonuclease [Streptomyces rubiginosohelvolus]
MMATTTPEEPLKPGTEMTRAQIIERFGGRPQGAISPSRTTATVVALVGHRPYNDPTHPQDGFTSDGTLHLTGEGSRGDQEMKQANKALLNAKDEGRAILVFHAISGTRSKKTYRYIGQFELDASQPYYLTDAADPSGGTRRVIVFQLKPVGEHAEGIPALPDTPPSHLLSPTAGTATERVARVPLATENLVMEMKAGEFVPRRSRTSVPAERREAALASAFAAHLRSLGHDVGRMQITIAGVRGSLFTDLVDLSDNVLYEVKNSASRAEIRMGIGQLFDYARHLGNPKLALLLPSKPDLDLVHLCTSLSIDVVWPDPDTGGFASSKH